MTELNTTLFDTPTGNPLIVITVPLLMFISGIVGNVLALMVLCRSNRDHRRNVFFRLVGGLACTDLFGILALSPVTICVYANGRKWIGGQPLCHYFSFFMIFAGIATVSIVGVMAFERYVAILQPYSYNTKFTPGKVIYILVTVWILSAFVACLPFLGLGRNVLHFPGTWCFFDYHGNGLTDKIFTYLYTFFGLFVIGVTAICNTAVMFVLVRMRHLVKKLNKHGSHAQVDNEAHMIILLAGIILVFATCYAPLMVRVTINQTHVFPINHAADLLTIRLACLNQILDPWVYILFRKQLFSKLWNLVTCSKKTKPINGINDKCLKNNIADGVVVSDTIKETFLHKTSTAKSDIISKEADGQECRLLLLSSFHENSEKKVVDKIQEQM
ncbi:prostaglandin E2 receptor EP4 subtype-like [Gigantopelta aegis]|uniref:prostaglandin E2 receptor EP4 subtype-like n=1 Tax=Gigantopelta aegis TaxID=1735272 RepID=UPI001B88B0C5|nr:prostaglandin E2 receptor EP4 subtype-like [Gigantopelta aegis]